MAARKIYVSEGNPLILITPQASSQVFGDFVSQETNNYKSSYKSQLSARERMNLLKSDNLQYTFSNTNPANAPYNKVDQDYTQSLVQTYNPPISPSKKSSNFQKFVQSNIFGVQNNQQIYQSDITRFSKLQKLAFHFRENLKSIFILPRLNFAFARNFSILLTLLIAISAGGFVVFANRGQILGSVAGTLKYEGSEVANWNEYKVWIEGKTNGYQSPYSDLDSDQLTNYEEFILNSNPKSKNTCSSNFTDLDNLLKLIDPVTCKPVDLNNEEQNKKFGQLLKLFDLQEKMAKSLESEKPQQTNQNNDTSNQLDKQGLLSLFGVSNYQDLDKLTPQALSQKNSEIITNNNTKIEYLKTIDKIDNYIEKNRSYEIYDRDISTPVGGAVYLDVSIRYKVPIKYVLAVARLESRFGTDRFTVSGNPTRPGQYKNIYSMGLTDSGSNLEFSTWEAGVESFGKWYQRFDSRGVSDCSKWRIYNPNGDYCAKVEALAQEIDNYIKS